MTNENNLQELQFLEQNLQNILFQKQNFQIELSESQNALRELESSGDEIYRIVGQLMIKSSREKIKDELSGKEKLLNIRIKTLDNQEKIISDRIEKIREQLISENPQ